MTDLTHASAINRLIAFIESSIAILLLRMHIELRHTDLDHNLKYTPVCCKPGTTLLLPYNLVLRY